MNVPPALAAHPPGSLRAHQHRLERNMTILTRQASPRIVVLGAGFGGLELTTLLSEELGDGVDVTLIDKSSSFVFGYSKFDVMFGRSTLDAVSLPYRHLAKPGVQLVRQ